MTIKDNKMSPGEQALTRGESMTTDPMTGGQKAVKPARMDLLPWAELMEVAELFGEGAKKYDDHNWRKGHAWSHSYAAMMRHAALFWEGERNDPETGCSHLAAVVFHALTLMHYQTHHPNGDDRPETYEYGVWSVTYPGVTE